MTALSRPFSGFVLADGRRGGLAWGHKPRCVKGNPTTHLLCHPGVRILTDSLVTCRHRSGRSGTICGAELYVRRFPRTKDEAQVWLVVETSPAHVQRMLREPMIFLERMVILGVALPGVEFDIEQSEESA